MNRLMNSIFSMRLMVVGLFIFFVAIGWATFIENDFGTPIAQKWVYKSTWFSVVIGYLFFGLINNIFRHKLFQLKKIGSLVFHISFLVTIAGAFLTRNIGFEGVMQIAEGSSSNVIISSDTYIQIHVDDLNKQYSWDSPIILDTNSQTVYDQSGPVYRAMASIFANDFYHQIDFPGQEKPVVMEYVELVKNVKDTVIIDQDEEAILEIVTVGNEGRHYNYLESGKVLYDGAFKIAFNNDEHPDAISIFESDSGIMVLSPFELGWFQMSDKSEGRIPADTISEFLVQRLYAFGNTQFVFSDYYQHGRMETISSTVANGGIHGIRMKVSQGDLEKEVVLRGGQGIQPSPVMFTMGDLNYRLAYGSKLIELPFYLYLKDFQLERYPGTNNPSSYASEVTLIDPTTGLQEDHRIYMNNVLDYEGYRFFQSSYDPSEMGTILSVNHDAAGTNMTYLGYLLMGLGFLLNLLQPGSRFRLLAEKANKIRIKREGLKTVGLLLALGLGVNTFGQTGVVDYDHAEKFGRLVVQDMQGRFKPVHTLATDILKKVHRSDHYGEMSAMQVFLGIHTYIVDPGAKDWAQEPLIYVSGKPLRKKLNLDGSYAAVYDFFTPEMAYLLQEDVDVAYRKKPSSRNEYDKDVIKTDERFNVLLGVFNGVYLQIFPKPADPNHLWITPYVDSIPFEQVDREFVENTMQMYFGGVAKGYQSDNWTLANQAVELISLYQRRIEDPALLPSEGKVSLEIWYNNMDIFKKLNYAYLIFGFILLLFQFFALYKPGFEIKWVNRICTWIFYALFIFHGTGLGIRWYLSGHAPWSNGYEAVVFVAFVTVLAGLVFSSRNKIILGATGILAWLMLYVAHMNSMDPQITNLVPVLKSYWLMIHVAIITGSYAFLGLGAVLALNNMFMYLSFSDQNKKRIQLTTKELTYVTEMTLTIGLFMLTIGTFLGGVWANESWGRYWGWDAKETWALASVLIYAVVLHLRFVPGLKGQFTFDLWALWSFGAIIMTFFGVNFYLSGLHSYATGDPVPIPTWVPVSVLTLMVLCGLAYWKYRKYNRTSVKAVDAAEEVE